MAESRRSTEGGHDVGLTYLSKCLENYAKASIYGDHYVDRALPRFLTLIVDFLKESDSESQTLVSNIIDIARNAQKAIPSALFLVLVDGAGFIRSPSPGRLGG